MRDEMVQSVQRALKCLLTIRPDVCERYLRLWRQDLADWKERAAAIRVKSSVEEALHELRLAPSTAASSAGKIRPRRPETVPNAKAGPVVIPRSDTMKKLSDYVGPLRLGPGIAETQKRETKPFPILTEEYSAAMLAARMNGGYSPTPGTLAVSAFAGCYGLGVLCVSWGLFWVVFRHGFGPRVAAGIACGSTGRGSRAGRSRFLLPAAGAGARVSRSRARRQ
jgi:hypothetical protein